MNQMIKSHPLDKLEITSDSGLKKSSNIYESRRNSKAATKAINARLCYLRSEIRKDYQAAYYCNEYLFQEGSKVTANYCRKRSCLVCSRIYTARLMKAYVRPLLELNDLHLVTLTAPNVSAENLPTELSVFYSAYTKIKDNIRKTYKIKLRGFRKLEITYSHRLDNFNPHYHILVESKEAADLVRSLWLKQFKDANYKAQDVRRISGSKALLEVFKYVTKTVIKDTFNPKALDAMYRSVKGRRVYQSMGIKKEVEVKIKEYETTPITHRAERIDVWKWCNDNHDWYTSSGESFNDGELLDKTKKVLRVIENTVYENEQEKQPEAKEAAEIFAAIRQERCRKIIEFD